MPGALYHIPGPLGIVPFHGPIILSSGGADAIVRPARSSPRRWPAEASPALRDPTRARSRSNDSSRAIDARTAESGNCVVRMAAEAVATAASDETARLPFAEFTAAYCVTLRSV